MKYIDVHSHIQFSQYDSDRAEVLKRMRAAGVGAIAVGCDMESSKKAVELAAKEPDIWAVVGIHPTDKRDEGFDPKAYESLLGPKTVAIGECGLDYYRVSEPIRRNSDLIQGERTMISKSEALLFRKDGTDEAEVARQKNLFETQLQFALQKDLPLMIHCRPSKGTMDAYDDLLSLLAPYAAKEKGRLRGNVHFFAGDMRVAKAFLELGFTLSFTGVVTFARDYDEVIRTTPLSMLLSETDCPYVAPVPHRGKRNESVWVSTVVAQIAAIRREDEEGVRIALLENARRVFALGAE